MVKGIVPRARIHFDQRIDIYTVTHEGWTCSLGVFPVSIKNEDFLQFAQDPNIVVESQDIKKKVGTSFHGIFFCL